jgi:hypothetical protein
MVETGSEPGKGETEDIEPGVSRSWRLAGRIVRVAIVMAVIGLFALLILKNVAPFGANVEYNIDFGDWGKGRPSPLTPATVIGSGEDGIPYELFEVKMTTDLVTFELDVPYDDIDTAEVTIRYKGDPGELLMGLTNKPNTPYLYKPIHNSSLNRLPWDVVTEGPLSLFQKSGRYASVEDLIANPPLPAAGEPDYPRAAEYYYEIPQPMPEIDPSRVLAETEIGASLRGQHSFHSYVDGGPVEVKLTKVELNRREGPDPLDVILYRGDEPIWADTIPDDGDEGTGGVLSTPREAGFVLEGLEAGVYRVDLVCGDDVVIEDLRSRQGYMSFMDGLYLADHELYGLGPSGSSAIFTNAQELSVYTEHVEAFQTLTSDDGSSLVIEKTARKYLWWFQPGLHEIRTEVGGIVLMSPGSSFSFTRESFFDPFPLKVEAYNEALLTTDIEYILGEYSVPTKDGEWLSRDLYFDLRGMEIEDGRLRFALLSPALQQQGGEIVLGSINIVLKKESGL